MQSNTTDKTIMDMLFGQSEYWKSENSNKDAALVHTQRDYIAGITSTDIARRILLDKDIVNAHDQGIIHFHDADYFAQNVLTNCCLINLEDMLQNGTCINGVYIEKPHRLITATTIATQIITAVSSSQYGGCTITLSHLAPFVNLSRKYYKDYFADKISNKEELERLVNSMVDKEIKDAIQTFNYQINSMTTTNGQTPFISVCMYLNEVEDEITKQDLATLIKEMLEQRIIGFKNRQGVYVTPAFPKLLYFLEEDNIHNDSKYYYLTELACKCSAKRMVPDFISEKIMKQLKGDAYPCMGCVDGKEVVTYKFNNNLYVESFERFWDKISSCYTPVLQNDITNNMFINVDNKDIQIYDTNKGFVKVKKLIRNVSPKWVYLEFSNGRNLLCTTDHPLPTERGRIEAKDITLSDKVLISTKQYADNKIDYDKNKAWLLGFILCNHYYKSYVTNHASYHNKNILCRYKSLLFRVYDLNIIIKSIGKEHNYKELIISPYSKYKALVKELYTMFEDNETTGRHIPSEVFSWNYESRLSFLAGMIDANNYLHTGSNKAQLYSTNRELSLQQMLLAQSLNMFATISTVRNNNTLYNCVEFTPITDLLKYVSYNNRNIKYEMYNDHIKLLSKVSSVKNIQFINNVNFSYDVETYSDHFEVSGIYSHNCRSFLTPDRTNNNMANALNYTNKHKYYGRFNQGVVTINLVDAALSSNKDMNMFEKILDERLELCHKALRARHDRLAKGVSDMSPIMWQDGALARLNKGESIAKLLYNGYSTLSLGYAGLYECVKYLTGESLTTTIGKELGMKIMTILNTKTNKWKNKENIDYSVYGTPIESTTYKFATKLKKRFGDDVFIKIDGRDRNYITNSYHIPVFEKIDPFNKLIIESEFQKLSPGGAISYIECADLTKNTEAVMTVVKFIYDNIMYAELNTKSDYCQCCGYDGEIKIIDKNNKLIWECPNCKNTDQTKMNVARRTCGYIGTNFFNQGRTNEIRDRYVHLDDHNITELC